MKEYKSLYKIFQEQLEERFKECPYPLKSPHTSYISKLSMGKTSSLKIGIFEEKIIAMPLI